MLSLPSKPWKKIRIEAVANDRYRLVFVTDFPDEAAFAQAIENDIRPALGASDDLDAPDWPSRSVMLTTTDLRTFKRNLVYACVMVEQP
jgi:hypothetical protein